MTDTKVPIAEWVRTPRDREITAQAIQLAEDFTWDKGPYEMWFAFVSGFRQGVLSVTDLRSHEPPRTEPTKSDQSEPSK